MAACFASANQTLQDLSVHSFWNIFRMRSLGPFLPARELRVGRVISRAADEEAALFSAASSFLRKHHDLAGKDLISIRVFLNCFSSLWSWDGRRIALRPLQVVICSRQIGARSHGCTKTQKSYSSLVCAYSGVTRRLMGHILATSDWASNPDDDRGNLCKATMQRL